MTRSGNRAAVHGNGDGGDDRGSIIVMMALLISVLFVMAAIVIDGGQLRDDRRTERAASDTAVAGGALDLLDPVEACLTSWKLFLDNTPDEGPVTSAPDCAGTFSGLSCSSSSAALTATGIAPPYTVEIIHPVPDGHDLMTDPTGSPSGQSTVAADGEPCDRLGMRVTRTREPAFGRVADAPDAETVSASVALAKRGVTTGSSVALLLLERNDLCALWIQGGSGAQAVAKGFDDSPGYVHADSDGLGFGCGTGGPERVLYVDSATNTDGIFAEESETPAGSETPGSISVTALLGAGAPNAHSPSPLVTREGTTDPPFGHPVIGRAPVDNRYLSHISSVRSTAQSMFAMTAAGATSAGWTVYGCNPPNPTPVPASGPGIYIDCANYQQNGTHHFEGPIQNIVFNGRITKSGPPGSTLHFDNVRNLYVKGDASGTNDWAVNSDKNFYVNLNEGAGNTTCADRQAENRNQITTFVLGYGGFNVNGQGGVRLCNTTMYLMEGSLPASPGLAPYPNSFGGVFSISGQGAIDWRAPNQRDDQACGFGDPSDPTCHSASTYPLEDLALWTEAEGPSLEDNCATSVIRSCVQGNGAVNMSGVFFIPNGNTVRLAGNGFQDVGFDAQYVSRKLQVAGNATLSLKPNPANVVLFPVIESASLIR